MSRFENFLSTFLQNFQEIRIKIQQMKSTSSYTVCYFMIVYFCFSRLINVYYFYLKNIPSKLVSKQKSRTSVKLEYAFSTWYVFRVIREQGTNCTVYKRKARIQPMMITTRKIWDITKIWDKLEDKYLVYSDWAYLDKYVV